MGILQIIISRTDLGGLIFPFNLLPAHNATMNFFQSCLWDMAILNRNKYPRWCGVQKDDIKYVTLIQNPLVQFRQNITRHSRYIPPKLHICRPANPEVTFVVACHNWVLLVVRSLTHCLKNHKMMVTSQLEKISRLQIILTLLLIHRLLKVTERHFCDS